MFFQRLYNLFQDIGESGGGTSGTFLGLKNTTFRRQHEWDGSRILLATPRTDLSLVGTWMAQAYHFHTTIALWLSYSELQGPNDIRNSLLFLHSTPNFSRSLRNGNAISLVWIAFVLLLYHNFGIMVLINHKKAYSGTHFISWHWTSVLFCYSILTRLKLWLPIWN